MDGKICVVTGATAGIGRVAAGEIAKKGATVIVVGRNPEKGRRVVDTLRRETGNDHITLEIADLSRQSEIRALAARLRETHDRIDVLLNNAGAYFLRRRETADGLEMTFALNHLGYFLLTGLVLDLVRAAPSGRIVNVASAAHRGGQVDFDDPQGRTRYNGWRAYRQSKLANLLFTFALAERLPDVTVNCLHPGFVASDFGHNNRGPTGLIIRLLQAVMAISETEGAETSVYLASSPEVDGTTGCYFDKCRAVESSPESKDRASGEALWTLSEELTGFTYP